MANKPLPQLRKPTCAAAASFVESQEPASSPPVLEVVRSAGEGKGPTSKRAQSASKGARRRMTLYLSKSTAKALKLQSFSQERDMSDIVEELLSKHLKAP